MTDEARELSLFIENDAGLYRQQGEPILRNLATKRAKGIYNHAGAVKLYGYLVESGAKKYCKEFCDAPWHVTFPPSVRREVAEGFARDFETEAALGNYDSLAPKKYGGEGRARTCPKCGGASLAPGACAACSGRSR